MKLACVSGKPRQAGKPLEGWQVKIGRLTGENFPRARQRHAGENFPSRCGWIGAVLALRPAPTAAPGPRGADALRPLPGAL